ncbi:MAG: ABC transporter substrate-binding protein [Tissierellales bacterium]|jgi:iron complex transport system substrate-binding protein|nr:ABC transporter substrate-binding protein [Tissierellales bacterium]
MKKRLLVIWMIVVALMVGCQSSASPDVKTENQAAVEQEVSTEKDAESTKIEFVDNMGVTIKLEKPAEKIISLYSVHTENLFALGLDDEIIGVSTSDKYPEDVNEKTKYTYKDDPEVIIAAQPDLVLVRDMIANKYPEYIQSLRDAGITVATLYVKTYDEFDEYMKTLGLLSGKEKEAEELLKEFHGEIDTIKAKVADQTPRKAYFESIGKKFKTATPESFAGTALQILNLENIAADVEHDGKSTVETYGEEQLLARANEIEIYIAQQGVMNRGITLEQIEARPGYDQIKAVKEGKVFLIDEKLISGATMRYIDGLKQLVSELYPNLEK